MTDIVKKLRNHYDYNPLIDALDAADEIERLRKERDEARPILQKALAVLARAFDRIHVLPRSTDTQLATEIEEVRAALRSAISLDSQGGKAKHTHTSPH
ncbi:MAG: hypothetical protein ACK5X3_05580 [Pseudomonadota bacterium]|jgi:K+-sensing histidine kinase KdpD